MKANNIFLKKEIQIVYLIKHFDINQIIIVAVIIKNNQGRNKKLQHFYSFSII
jgi:hypothetical protein